jgi:formylglycine-generating enzyme required for sulfatase activity
VSDARSRFAGADRGDLEANRLRGLALSFFAKTDIGAAEDVWKQMLEREESVERQRREGGGDLDRALALEPNDAEARSLYADALYDRILAAERLHKRALMQGLRARLEQYDDRWRLARLRAPAHVSIETEPSDAALTLSRYVDPGDGGLVEGTAEPLRVGRTYELEPGSYLLVGSAPGRYPTRYPFAVRRGETRTLRVGLPPRAGVPADMVYVPAGPFAYGSGDDELQRSVLQHQPEHTEEIGAFLIARTEVTCGAYLEYLRDLPERERDARAPLTIRFSPAGVASLEVRHQHLAEGQPFCTPGRPCVDWSRLPIDGVSRDDALAYASWLARFGRLAGARLCTDREWERAARGADDRRFPWGNRLPRAGDVCWAAGQPADSFPCEVGTHPASRSPFEVDDMAGNVWEWTSDPADIAKPGIGTMRGGSYGGTVFHLDLTNRALQGHSLRSYGIRLCADAP